ncbi:MAG: LysR family transcriptional regulator [Ruminococcaceae bacterium]|nr:LysR family transcriptional regulator [Oscillospiraceae bacterium]
MEIRNLLTLVHVAEQNSFTKAAAVLGYSQSTISFQIKQLETELNCLLFERINHNIALTEKGKEVLEYAQQIRHLTEEFQQNLNDASEISGHIHIVTSDSICEDMLLTNYPDFYRNYPKIELKFSTADTDEMFRMLSHNEADVMFTLDNHIFRQNYVIAKEESVPAHFVAGNGFPIDEDTEIKLQDIISYPFILTEKGEGYRHAFDSALARMSVDIKPVLEVGRTDIITSLLEKSQSVSYLPDFVTKKMVSEKRLKYVNVTDFEGDIWKQLIYHKSKWLSKPFKAFLSYVMKNEFSR